MNRKVFLGTMGLLLWGTLLLSPQGAAAGDRAGNGGDPLAAEFVARGYFVLNYLRKNPSPALLSSSELAQFAVALRDTRIEVVDYPLAGAVLSKVMPDPADARERLIRIYGADWLDGERLGVDLVHHAFHDYLLVLGQNDNENRISDRLAVTELDFKRRPMENTDCPNGQMESVGITLRISLDFPYLRYPSYVNGTTFDSEVLTSNRIFRSPRLCSTKTYSFHVAIGNFARDLVLPGGADVTLAVPSGAEFRN